MAPSALRLCQGLLELFTETLLAIVEELPRRNQRALMATCSLAHDISATVLYHTITVHGRRNPRPSTSTRPKVDIDPIRFLTCLVRSTNHSSSRYCYASYIRSFTFTSHVQSANIRAIPLLVAAIPFMDSLVSFRIDLCEDSVPLALDLFRRSNVTRNLSTMSFTATESPSPFSVLILPALKGVRAANADIGVALSAWRSLDVVIIDNCIDKPRLDRFVSHGHGVHAGNIAILSLTLDPKIPFTAATRALATSFPKLEYLSLRSDPMAMCDILEVRKLQCCRVIVLTD